MCSKIHEGRSDFMSYYNKRNQEPLPKEDVSTWECTKEDCNGWTRKTSPAVIRHCALCAEVKWSTASVH